MFSYRGKIGAQLHTNYNLYKNINLLSPETLGITKTYEEENAVAVPFASPTVISAEPVLW